jgi:hypothetical protein
MKFVPVVFIGVASLCRVTAMFTAISFGTSATRAPESERTEEPCDWTVSLNRSGGNLSAGDEKIAIAVKAGRGTGTRTKALSKGGLETKEVTLPDKATRLLWKTMEEVKAWELDDFRKPELDAPDYTIRLERAGKKHTIKVQGASASEAHHKLILAIERCFAKGASQ